MNEVRFYARKGQGAVESARVLASAYRLAGRDASWHIPPEWEDKSQLEAGIALAEENRRHNLSALVVFCPSVLDSPDIWVGFERPDVVLINTRSILEGGNISEDIGVASVDATGIARTVGAYSGLPGIVAPMLGALAAVTNSINASNLEQAIKEASGSFGLDQGELKMVFRAVSMGYKSVKISRGWRPSQVGDTGLLKSLSAS